MNNKLLLLIESLNYSLVDYSIEIEERVMGRCYLLRKQIDLYHTEINKNNYNINYILAHEIIHATLLPLKRGQTRYYYQHEEAVAEFGAYLLLKRLDINVENSYKITRHYINRMKSYHSNQFVSVYYDAHKAVNYLMELYECNK